MNVKIIATKRRERINKKLKYFAGRHFSLNVVDVVEGFK